MQTGSIQTGSIQTDLMRPNGSVMAFLRSRFLGFLRIEERRDEGQRGRDGGWSQAGGDSGRTCAPVRLEAMPRGYFITFEGLDGSGKTTQLKRLAEALRADGRRVTTLRQPGGTRLGERIRSLLVDSGTEAMMGPIAPYAELGLMFADRAQSIAEVIRPALGRGEIVLCDRYTDSSEAYQGGGRGLGSETVLAVHRALCGDLQPDLTILLLPPLATALRRARRRNLRHIERRGEDENRFEREPDDFYQRIHAAYRVIARREVDRVVTIEDDVSIDAIEVRIRSLVDRHMAQAVLGA